MFSSYKRVFWLAAVMSLFVYVPFNTVLFSTDVWTRMARISEWASAGFPFHEQLLMSQNYPFGFELHWTRPMDYIGYLFAWPFIPNWGLKTALEMMAHFVPILMMLVAVRGFFFGLKGYLTPKMAFISFWLFFFGIGYAWGQGSIGYFDHHIFHFALLVWSIGLIARSFRVQNNKKYLIMGGIVSGLGTWTTPEFFINSYLLMTPFVFGWFWHNKSLKPAIIYTLSYVLVLLSAMSFDHPMSGFLTLDFARTSLFHVILGIFNLCIFTILSCPLWRENRMARMIYGILTVSAFGVVTLLCFHEVLFTPMVDPMMYKFWVKKVDEMRPLYESWNELAIYSILPLLLAIGLGLWCVFSRHRRTVPLAIIAVSGTLFYASMMIFHRRVGLSQSAFFIFLGSCYLNLAFFPREKSFYRSLAFILFYLVFIGIFQKGEASIKQFKTWGIKHYLEQYKQDPSTKIPEFLKEPFDQAIKEENEEEPVSKNEDKKPEEDVSFSCTSYDKIWNKIKQNKEEGAILTDIFSAPQIQWETGKPVLGGPYDRNIQGLLDLFAIELDLPPYEKAYELLKKHHVTQLYLQNPRCMAFLYEGEKSKKLLPEFERFFHSAVYYGSKEMPKWVKLEYWDKKTNIKIFRVIPKEGN